MAVSANRLELLQIADAVAREKGIDRMIVVAAMEDAIQKAARQRYGSETDVRAEINPKTGEIKLQRLLKVVERIENTATDITLEDARERATTTVRTAAMSEILVVCHAASTEVRAAMLRTMAYAAEAPTASPPISSSFRRCRPTRLVSR